jgi:hypothetical protein
MFRDLSLASCILDHHNHGIVPLATGILLFIWCQQSRIKKVEETTGKVLQHRHRRLRIQLCCAVYSEESAVDAVLSLDWNSKKFWLFDVKASQFYIPRRGVVTISLEEGKGDEIQNLQRNNRHGYYKSKEGPGWSDSGSIHSHCCGAVVGH